MIRVNLLPHREEKRKARRKQFYALIGLLTALVGVIWFFGYTAINQYISIQEAKNAFIEKESLSLDKEIKDIAKLKEETDALLKRKQVIETLQGSRAETALMFDELLRRVPDGIQLLTFSQTGGGSVVQFDMTGVSISEARVSSLMRNLEDSPMFQLVTPIEIRSSTAGGRNGFSFQMKMQIERATITAGAAPAAPAGRPGKS